MPIELIVIGGILTFFAIAWIAYESQFETVETNEREESGKVVDLSYKSAESDTDVVPTFVNGSVGVGISTHDTPERYLVVVRGTNEVKKVIIDDESFYDEVEEGKTVKIELKDKHKVRKGERPNKSNYVETLVTAIVVDKKRLTPELHDVKFA